MVGCSCNSQLTQGGLAGCRACHRKSTVTIRTPGLPQARSAVKSESEFTNSPGLSSGPLVFRVRVARVVRAWFVRARAAQHRGTAQCTHRRHARALAFYPPRFLRTGPGSVSVAVNHGTEM